MIDLEKIKEQFEQLGLCEQCAYDFPDSIEENMRTLVAEVERLRARRVEIADGFAFQLLTAYTELERAIDLIKSVEWMTHTGGGGQRCVFCKEFYPDHKPDCGRQLILADRGEG